MYYIGFLKRIEVMFMLVGRYVSLEHGARVSDFWGV